MFDRHGHGLLGSDVRRGDTAAAETFPFALFFARTDCLSKQIRILNLSSDAPTIAKYLKDHFRVLLPVVEEIVKTQKGEAGKFLYTLAVNGPVMFPKI
jgi:hypothetical protein